jgi:hypothetical protein
VISRAQDVLGRLARPLTSAVVTGTADPPPMRSRWLRPPVPRFLRVLPFQTLDLVVVADLALAWILFGTGLSFLITEAAVSGFGDEQPVLYLLAACAVDPKARLAVIAWLGYDSPRTPSLGEATDGAATGGAEALRRTVARVRGRTRAPVTLLCHSYGSVVCAKALPGLPVSDVAVFGSPGLEVERASDLGSAARLWAGRGAADWVRFVPPVKIGPLGFGPDPVTPSFGARIFAAGPGGHSDYFRPGSRSLRNLALITLGRASEVEVAR